MILLSAFRFDKFLFISDNMAWAYVAFEVHRRMPEQLGFALWTVMPRHIPGCDKWSACLEHLFPSLLISENFRWATALWDPLYMKKFIPFPPPFIYITCSDLWSVKLLSFISGWGWGEPWKAGQWNDEEPRPWGPRAVWHLILSYVGFLTLFEFFLFLSLHFLICKMGIINFTSEKSCGNEINHFKHLPWCPMESKMNSSYDYSGAKLIGDPNLFTKWA